MSATSSSSGTSDPHYSAAVVVRGDTVSTTAGHTSGRATASIHASSLSAAVVPPHPSNNYYAGSTTATTTTSLTAGQKRPHFNNGSSTTTSSSNDSSHYQSFTSVASITGNGPSTTTTTATKRPYRRTKRPKDYNDRSTITATTLLLPTSTTAGTAPGVATGMVGDSDTSNNNATTAIASAATTASSNPYDAILDESNDLLRAAHEAQQLGRYSMASAYLLLLHARLVGLGRRFDKSLLLTGGSLGLQKEQQEQVQEPDSPSQHERGHDQNEVTLDVNTDGNSHLQAPNQSQNQSNQTPSGSNANVGTQDKHDNQQQRPGGVDPLTPKTRATKEFLSHLIPRDIEWDRAMMEHLARAAVELHAARSGHKKPVHYQSPDAARHFWANTANQLGVTTAATQLQQQQQRKKHNHAKDNRSATHNAFEPKKVAADSTGESTTVTTATASTATASTTTDKGAASGGIAWTDEEIRILNVAMSRGKRHPNQLVEHLPGRTEQQIKLYLKNQMERQRVHQETMQALSSSTTAEAADPSSLASVVPASSSLTATVAASDTATSGGGSGLTGRSRKPATAATNTVPNAVCDARALLLQAQEQQRRQEQS